jgi:transposase
LYSQQVSDAFNKQISLSRAETEACEARVSNPGEQRRYQVILLEAHTSLAEIVGATGYRPRTIRQIAQRFRDHGLAGREDGRKHSTGASPILSLEEQDELRLVLQTPPSDGGVWTGPKVAQWIAAKTGKPVHRQRGWEYWRRLGTQTTT